MRWHQLRHELQSLSMHIVCSFGHNDWGCRLLGYEMLEGIHLLMYCLTWIYCGDPVFKGWRCAGVQAWAACGRNRPTYNCEVQNDHRQLYCRFLQTTKRFGFLGSFWCFVLLDADQFRTAAVYVKWLIL